jgi:hypothetical protein
VAEGTSTHGGRGATGTGTNVAEVPGRDLDAVVETPVHVGFLSDEAEEGGIGTQTCGGRKCDIEVLSEKGVRASIEA